MHACELPPSFPAPFPSLWCVSVCRSVGRSVCLSVCSTLLSSPLLSALLCSLLQRDRQSGQANLSQRSAPLSSLRAQPWAALGRGGRSLLASLQAAVALPLAGEAES
jgi:hypothetical protein